MDSSMNEDEDEDNDVVGNEPQCWGAILKCEDGSKPINGSCKNSCVTPPNCRGMKQSKKCRDF